MDAIRSAYRVNMKFTRGSDVETPVQWYFAASNAAALGLPTLFGSRAWEYTTELPPAIGEQNARSWRGGLPPAGVGAGGLCGSADQWANGALPDDPLAPTWPRTNLPRCCTPAPIAAAAGAAVGPQARQAVIGCCAAMPAAVKIKFLGSDDPGPWAPGTEWILPASAPGCFFSPSDHYYLSDLLDIPDVEPCRWHFSCADGFGAYPMIATEPPGCLNIGIDPRLPIPLFCDPLFQRLDYAVFGIGTWSTLHAYFELTAVP